MVAIKDWTSLSKTMDPEFEAAAKAMGTMPDLGAFPDIPTMRAFFEKAKANATASLGPATGVKETDHQVTMRDGVEITCRVYQTERATSSGSPLAVVYHGGGWCIGGLVNEQPLCRELANLGIVVVNVDYRLAPEYKFPTAVYDAFDATIWAAKHATSFGADPSKGFTVGGTSAGGNLAAVVAHLWRDNNQSPKLTGVHLMIPAICWATFLPEKYKVDSSSWDDMKDAPILSRKACDLYIGNYCPEEKDRANPLFSPLLFETGHKDLPPTYFQICGMDPLRDEALIYERLLREEACVKTRLDVYPGLPHGYWSLFPQLKASSKFLSDGVEGVKWLLAQ